MASTDTAKGCPCPAPKVYPLLRVAYPNENKSHFQVQPVEGTPGVDPCCMPSGSGNPCFDETYSRCPPISCNAGAHDPNAPGSCYDSTTLHQRQCECPKCVAELHKFQEDERICYQHTEGNRFQDLRKIHHDPEIQAIRDRLSSSETMKNTLRWCTTDESLTCVDRRFRAQSGLIGEGAVHYGTAQDLDYPRELIHGVLSDEWTPAADLLNPPPQTWYSQLITDVQESIYDSSKTKPIGKSHDQRERLPAHVDPEETAFGKPSDKSISAGILVNPPKSRFQIEGEAKEFQPLYRFTHGDYDPGEQLCRRYDGAFSKHNTFGLPTPNDWAGRLAKDTISRWRACGPDIDEYIPPCIDKSKYNIVYGMKYERDDDRNRNPLRLDDSCHNNSTKTC